MNSLPRTLSAKSPPSTMRLTGAAKLLAAVQESGALRKFHMDAYNGGQMNFEWSEFPVVVDLSGVDLTSKARPILKDHDPAQVVGHADSGQIINSGTTLSVDGLVSGTGPAAQEVVSNADNGFPWQASIGCTILTTERIAAGIAVAVNGQNLVGPLLIVRTSRLNEVSFVALGADDSTSAAMVAARSQRPQGKTAMSFEDWVKSLGLDPATLTPEAKAVAQKAYDAMMAEAKKEGDGGKATPPAAAAAPAAPDPKTPAAASAAAHSSLQASRTEAADESIRVGAIRKLCAGAHTDIEANAIRDGWSVDKTEVTVMRAARQTGPAIHSGISMSDDPKKAFAVLEAALLHAGGLSNLAKTVDAQTLDIADKKFKGRMSLQRFVVEAARIKGYSGYSFSDDREGVFQTAFGRLEASGFSTINVPGILGNVANKFLLDGFMGVDQSWKKIAAIRPVNDFKATTSYRMTGSGQFDKVGPTGELKSAAFGEESYTNKADTYGKLVSITRHDLINDDLGALTKFPKTLGRGGALKLNSVLWTEFLADADTFFTSGHLNYFTGATASLLTIDGLTTAVQKFRDQVDSDGNPLSIAPAFLVVPTGLEVAAQNLFSGQNLAVTALASTSAAATAPNVNPHAGKYEVVVSPYLNNANFTGYSAVAWYLLSNPADLAMLEVAFLNGNESPIIETADADFGTLGIQMRGYHDFGVKKQDYRAAVKSKGAA